MAKNDSEMRMLQSNADLQESIKKEVETGMLEMQRKKRRRELDNQINTLVERAIAFEDLYGSEDYRTQIMEMFLDVTLEMKSAIDLLNDVGVALQCIGQAIGCIDDVLNMQQEMLSSSLEQKYGFWERLKRRRKLRKAMRNNQARMQQMCDMIVGSQKMAMSVVSALRKSLVKMKATTEKSFAKQNKRDQKKKSTSAAPEQPSLAKKLMAEVRAQKGGDTGAGGNGGGNGAGGNGSGSAPTGSSDGSSTDSSSSGDTRDISGII